jgi:hypothetical protein
LWSKAGGKAGIYGFSNDFFRFSIERRILIFEGHEK